MAPRAHILVDADACPVKDETYRVAARHGVPVTVVANSGFRVPMDRLPDGTRLVTPVIVSDRFDAADDWIAEQAAALVGEGVRTIVVTADIPLADRALKAGAVALKPTGREWDAANIGGALATRAIMADLRAGADGASRNIGGPPPFSKNDRSNYLQALDRALTRK